MSVPKKNIIGMRLKQLRREKHITQDHLSAKLARQGITVDRVAISKIETGTRCVYDFELKAIAQATGTTLTQLLGN
jgi:transcriptional regulator with XRE-family HTH domain